MVGRFIGALGVLLTAATASAADVEAGRTVFNKCRACHSLEQGAHRVGPSLHGVMGRTAGTAEGFRFSQALQESGIIWDAPTLDGYLADPRGFIEGNRMSFKGLSEAKDREDVIAFLTTQTGDTADPATPDEVFGTSIDVAFATKLWQAAREARLTGPESIGTRPYDGMAPHGDVVSVLESEVTVDGRAGPILVKKNYLGDGITVDSVATLPRENLDSITVMFRREAGFDPDNGNWFWVKYGPGGTVLENQKHTKLAGRVGKDADVGCLACHQTAPGDDFVFLHDMFAD